MKFLINFVSTNQPTTTPRRRRGQQHGGTFQRDIWWAAAAAGESQSDGDNIKLIKWKTNKFKFKQPYFT